MILAALLSTDLPAFDRSPSESVFRPIADLEVDLTEGPPSAIGGHFAVDLQAAVKAAAKAPLIFRQLGRRRILRNGHLVGS